MSEKSETLSSAVAACLPKITQEAKNTCQRWFTRNPMLIIGDTISEACLIMLDGPGQTGQKSGPSLSDYIHKTVLLAAGIVADRDQTRLIARLKRRPPEQKTDVTPDEEGVAEALQTQAEVRAAMDSLAECVRQPLVMRYYYDMASAEIAHVLRTTSNAVDIRLHRGRRALASLLARHGTYPCRPPSTRKRARRRG